MKTTISRVLWSVLAAALLQGCVITQPPVLYSQGQQPAFNVYGMRPAATNTVLLMNTALPPRFVGYPNATAVQLHQVTAPFSAQEERFISQYYSLR